MKTVLAFWAATIAFLSGLLFWRNKVKYRGKSIYWLILKSASELAILLVTAFRLPVLLCAWIGMWATRPIKEPWLRVTVSVLLSFGLGYFMVFAMEVILVLSVFCVDDITGEENGFLKNLKDARAADKRRGAIPAAA